jgi:hypothetical protein
MIGPQLSELIAEVCLATDFTDSDDVAPNLAIPTHAVGGAAAGRYGRRRMDDADLAERRET